MPIAFLKLAEAEFDDAVDYYESEQAGSGLQLRREVSRCLNRIEQFPLACSSFSDRTRRCLVAGFPYSIIYRYNPVSEEILIVAFAHLHRRPEYWGEREE